MPPSCPQNPPPESLAACFHALETKIRRKNIEPELDPARRLPTFLIIGAMKGGTTSLYHYLGAHPQVFLPRIKEVDYFTDELNAGRGIDWYHRLFRDAPAETVAFGEASTSYTKYPRFQGAPQRIADLIPGVRLVYVVRDPLARIRSHHRHNVTLGEESDDLSTAVRRDPAYLDYSRYATQIDRYMELFPRHQLLVITSEDLRDHRRDTVRRVLLHIGADAQIEIPNLDTEFYRSDERGTYGPLVTGIRSWLKKRFPDRVGLWRGWFIPPRVKRALSKPSRGSADARAIDDLSEETRAFLTGELADEVARLRAYLPPTFDGWGIA